MQALTVTDAGAQLTANTATVRNGPLEAQAAGRNPRGAIMERDRRPRDQGQDKTDTGSAVLPNQTL